jgi:hypothetical protein
VIVIERGEVGEVADVVVIGHEADPDVFAGVGSGEGDHSLSSRYFDVLEGCATGHCEQQQQRQHLPL